MISVKANQSVTVWGDSVMRGVIYDEQRGKYTLLPECGAVKASRALGFKLNNRSRMGCTVTKGLAIMQKDLQQNALGDDIALIEFGGNDCDYNWQAIAANPEAEHHPQTPLVLFEKQLTEMVHLAELKGMVPVMMTLPPIHAQRYFHFFTRNGLRKENILKWLGDVEFIYRWHERYNAAVVRVAQKCGCLLADVREIFLGNWHYEDWLCIDGIHPNEKGHAAIDRVLEEFGFRYAKADIVAG